MASGKIHNLKIIRGTVTYSERTLSTTSDYNDISTGRTGETITSQMDPNKHYMISCNPVTLNTAVGILTWVKDDILYTTSNILSNLMFRVKWLYGNTTITPIFTVILIPID